VRVEAAEHRLLPTQAWLEQHHRLGGPTLIFMLE
jgi:hypothetical protein